MSRERVVVYETVKEVNVELFGDSSWEVNKMVSLLPESDKFIALDSDSDEVFDSIVETEFVGSIDLNTETFCFRISDDNKAILFTSLPMGEGELSYIIATLDSDVATLVNA